MTSFIVAHIIESSRFIFVLMTLNFATLTTLLTFRPTWHTPHLEWWNDIKVGNMNDEVIILLFCSIIKRPDFCGVYELFYRSFLKVFLHSFNVSTCSVDLSAKLTGLRTSGKHAKPQRAESQVQGPGVTTSHRSAPATFTHHTIWANITLLLKIMQCWFL